MRQNRILLLGLFVHAVLLACPALGQAPNAVRPDLGLLASGKGAQVFNRNLTTEKDAERTVARLDARPGDGGALIEGVQIGEGTIEVDLRGKDVAQQSFVGIAFHFVDWTHYDAVYFRPFNFRAANQEQRAHALQYVSHPVYTWQKLRTERPGQFEKPIEPPPDPNAWFHARIVLAKSKVEVYVNRATTPSLVVDDLGEAKSGGVALWAGNGSDGAYANLEIRPSAPPGPPPASQQTIFDAARTGNLVRLKTLVDADPGAANARMIMGATPLHLAAANGQKTAAEYLVSKGADLNAVARHAGTPLDLAYESDRPQFVAWLESKGGRFTPLQFDVAELTPAVHRLAFPWGMMNNVVVFSGTDGAVLVDSGFSTRALPELRRVVCQFSPSGVRYVIDTHDHGDHVAGNALAPDASSVITAATLAAPPAGLDIRRDADAMKGHAGRVLPTGYTWRAGASEIRLIPRPGLHSETDVIVYLPKESVVAMGDLLLSESVPAVSDLPGYLAFLDDVLDVFPENTTFVSGHGRELNTAGVRAYRDDVKAMIRIVQDGLAAGRTADQMVENDVLKAYKPRYSLLSFLAPDMLIPRVTPPQAANAAVAPGAEEVVRSLYRCVSFEAGKNVDWEQVKLLFIPEAVITLRTSRTAMSVFDRDGFVRDFVKFIGDAKLADRAFEERILAIKTIEAGEVARSTVHYAARIPSDGRPPQEGIDFFQLMKKDGAWKIVSIVNETVRPGVPVPAELQK